MFLAIPNVLPPEDAAAFREAAEALAYDDGRATAGATAGLVKTNAQAAPGPERDALLAKAQRAILSNAVFTAAAHPKALTPLILSRYRPGDSYGMHVDNALMGGLRTDLSFTLFLSDPAAYEGGALEVEDTYQPRAIRLGAGDLILYPSTSLHRVAPVTAGERLAVVGWVQSLIRGDAEREVLFDLAQVRATLDRDAASNAVRQQLGKVHSNLLRLWAET